MPRKRRKASDAHCRPAVNRSPDPTPTEVADRAAEIRHAALAAGRTPRDAHRPAGDRPTFAERCEPRVYRVFYCRDARGDD